MLRSTRTPVARAACSLFLVLLLVFSVFHLPGVAFAAGVPSAVLNVPAEQFIGEDVSFTVAFDNTSTTDTGYGPYLDVILPATGADGNDGLTFTSATFLGQPVMTTQLTFPGPGPTGCVAHPYAVNTSGTPVPVCGKTGDKLLVFQLPFGSFTPDQPPAVVTVNAKMSNLADLGTPLTIQARAGFQYGNTPLNDPATDPTIIQPSFASASVTPILLKLKKIYVGPEDETATGPNFPRKYIVQVDVANGQTVTNLDVTDLLPNNLAFLAVDSTQTGGTNVATTAITTPPVDDAANPPNNALTRRFASVTGTTAANDAEMTFSFYVPHLDANGTRVIDPITGDDVLSQNQAKAVGNWTPIDPRDLGGTANAVADPPGPEHVLTDKSIAIQKSVASAQDNSAPGISPADVLAYTLNFQVSDFFAFDQIVVTDVLSDGQRFDSTFAPTLLVNGHSYALTAAAMNTSNYSIDTSQIGNDTNPATNGSSTITFRVSDEISGRGADARGRMVGGCVPVAGTAVAPPYCKSLTAALPNDSGTTGVIVFRAVIQRNFSDTYLPGTASVDQGDKLQNDVMIGGRVLDNSDATTPTGKFEEDTSGAGVEIARGALVKTIYATNGVICNPQPCSNARLTPGQTVTYRLHYDLPLSSIEGFYIEDYMPLPVLKVNDPDANGTAGPAWSFDPAAMALPPSGVVTYGPADTFHLLTSPTPPVPTVTSDATANSLKLLYGDYAEATTTWSTIDLLLTVTASADPFTDGLFLTNQARAREGATNNTQQVADSIVQIKLTEPVLGIKKGVVATDNPANLFSPAAVGPVPFNAPGSTGARFTGTISSTGLITRPIDSNVSNIDAGDLVTFALVVENTGRSQTGAFDVRIRDTLPAGFAIPGGGLNLGVTDGTGAALAFTDLGSGLFDPAGGIELTDGATTGALARGKDDADATVNDGKNIAIITYDLVLQTSIQPNQTLVNTGTLFNYAGANGAIDHTTTDLTDVAFAMIAPPKAAKTLVGTEINNANNSTTQAVIGEIATYSVTLTLPEGTTPNAKIVDTLDSGLAFVNVVSVTPSADISFTGSSTPTITNNGGTATFDLGTVTNANTDNSVPETIMLVYRAVVLNVAGNQSGTLLNNSATFSWSGGSLASVSAAKVTVIEPTVGLTKTVVVDGSGTIGDAGDTVQYTITIGGVTGADAFDLTLNDVIPIEINAPTISSVTDSAGVVTAADFQITGSTTSTLSTVGSLDLPVNASRAITIVINGTLKNTVTPNQSIPNTATIQWSSLDGTPGQRSTYNPASTERTGAGGIDDYMTTSTANVTIFAPAPVKTLISTSEAHTIAAVPPANERVAIGEIVRFRLAVRIAEGSSPNLILKDDPEVGLRFLDDGTAKVAFVSNDSGGGIVSSDPTIGTGPQVTGNTDTVVPTFVLPNFAVSSQKVTNDDTYVDGTPVYIKLGNLTNNDSDADSEYVVIELNMLVSNRTTNLKGTTRYNGFSVESNGTDLGASNSVNVTIAEPTLTLAKTIVAPAPIDAGDTVTYKLVYTNGSGVNDADAFDVVLTDTLDTNLTLQTVTVTSKPGYATATDNSNIGANKVDVLVNQLKKGESVIVTVTAKVKPTVPNRQVIPNTGKLTWTSLPGTNGTTSNPTGSATPGASGSATGERNGSGGAVAPNTYAASSTVSTTLAAPVIAKQTPSPTTYTIGDLVTYYIRVTLPEGVTRSLAVKDTLPAGLSYVSHQVITTAAASAGNMTQDYSGTLSAPGVTLPGSSGGVLTLTFGDTTTTDDNNVNNNRFVVQVVARVLNASTPLSQKGNVLPNNASLDYKQGTSNSISTVNSSTINITIIEPQITTAKSVNPTSGVQAGSILAYTAIFTNTGNSPAYDVTATDILAQGTAYNAGSASCVFKNGAAAATSIPVMVTPGSGTISFDGNPAGSWDIPVTTPASYIKCTYTATAQSSLYVGGAHTNTIDANWSSQDGSVAGERVYNDTPGYTVDGTQDTAQATFNVAAPTFSKSDGGTINATIGQPITYTLTITSPIGTIRNLAVVDTLPVGLIYDTSFAPVISGISPTPAATVSSPNNGSAAVTVTWNFGDAVVASSPVTIRFRARVADVASNQSGVARTNGATLTYNNPANVPQTPLTSADGFTVVEPIMAISKNIVEATADAGDRVNVTLTVQNTGTSDSYDTIITDTLDAAFDSSSVLPVTTPAGFSYSIAGNTVTYTGGTVVKGAPALTFTFSVKLGNGVLPGAVVPNNARVAQATTLPGPVPGERNEPPVTSSDTITINSNSLSGFVYVDANNNGVKNAGETPIQSVIITLTGTDHLGNTVNITTTTNSSGAYSFPNLRPGTYKLAETQPSTYFDGKDTLGTQGGTAGNDQFTAIALPTGTSTVGTDNNFGELDPASLSGFVYVDANNDGNKDTGETAIGSVLITLTGTDDLGATVTLTTTTDPSGAYSFPNLRPGTYKLAETQPGPYLDGKDKVGSQGGTLGNDQFTAITLASGTNGVNNNFGELQPASLSGFVYNDVNNDGNNDTGEVGIGGVLITLNGTDDLNNTVTLATTTTSGSGAYTFPNLRPGTYTLTETQPAGYSDGKDTVGTQGGTLGNDQFTAITLASGTVGTDNNFGELYIPAVAKALISTSEPSTSGSNVTIGEVARYELKVELLKGTLNQFTVQDFLPTGMQFLLNNNIEVAYVSDTPVTGFAAGTFTNATNSAAVSSQLTSDDDSYGDGTPVYFKLGNLVNNDSDANKEFVIIRFDVLVLNTAGNQNNVALQNTFGVLVDTNNDGTPGYISVDANGDGLATGSEVANDPDNNGSDAGDVPGRSNTVTATLVEPTLTITKAISQPSANAGDLITYTLTVKHPVGDVVTAFDAVISDTVPAGVTYEPGSATISSGPAGTTVYTAPNTLNWRFPAIAPGETAVLTFQARVDNPALASTTNTADVTWTSLPGSMAEERTGSGGVNDYRASDSATLFTTSYALSKTLIAPASGVAGVNDTVRFSIVVTNTGATTLQTVPLTDTYDTTYLTYQNATPASNDNTDDGTINWSNIASGGPIAPGATRTVTVTFTAKAPTLPSDTTNNAATSGVTDANGTALPLKSDSANVAIGQPDLRISKTDGVSSTTPGAVLTYTLTITNSGTYTATGGIVTETLPLNTSFGNTAGWTDQGNDVYTYTLPAPLGPGQSISVTFSVIVDSSVPASATQISNSASVGDDGSRGTDPTPGNNTATDSDTLQAVPDLTISKSDGGITAQPGDSVSYTLDYQNTGNRDAVGVVITETVPLHTTFDANNSTAGWSCANGAPAGTMCTLTVGALNAGEQGSATFAVNVAASLPAGITQLDNTARIGDDGSNGADPTPANNSASDDTPLDAAPNMQISKSDGGITAVSGGTITYTLTYTNSGDQDATGVVLTETLPLHSSFVGPAGWQAQGSGVYTYSVGNLAAGASGSATFVVRVDDPLTAGVTQLDNTVRIGDDGSNGADPTPNNNQSSVTTPIAALQISKTLIEPAGGLAGVNDTVRFSIVITNTGATALETVPLDDTYNAAMLQYESASIPPDATAAGTLHWDDLTGTGSLAPGATLTVDVTFTALTPTATATINRADVAGATDAGGTALLPRNDSASVAIGQPDLRISKTDGMSSTTPGATLTYTLTITNSGTYTATGVLIDDTLPAYTGYNSDNVGWDDLDEDGTFTYTLPAPLGPGESISVTFLVNVDSPVPTNVNTITNTASVADDESHGADPTPGNNTATDIDALVAAPNLAISKTHSGDFLVGHDGDYTLHVTNNGTTGTTGAITITDALPNGLSYVSFSGSGWNCAANGQNVTCTHAGPLDPGNSLPDLTLTVNVGAAAWPGVTNSATVATAGEGDLSDNSAADPTTVRAPDLQLSKQADRANVTPGATVVYTLRYTNTGNLDATGVVITETVPLNTSFDAATSATGWACAAASAGSICTLSVGAVVQGASGTTTFAVIVDQTMQSGVTTITNTASISDDHQNGDDPTDNNQAQANVSATASPTAIGLVSFTATAQDDGVLVRWATSAELNTAGFVLYRSSDGTRASAEQITPERILARGRGQGGASYSWLDTTVQPGVTYSYWLEEVADDGTTTEYGPVTVAKQTAAQNRVFLPMVGR